MRRYAGAALAAALFGVLVACAPTPSSGPGNGEQRPDVDVDTPALRALKAEAGVQPCVPGTAEPVEGGLPEVTLRCLGGGPEVDLARLRGPLVVNLWAGWCGPCRREMPVLQAFSEKYAGKVGVLGIDYKDVQVEAALELVRETGVTYPLLADPDYRLEGEEPFGLIRGLPATALVGADGRVRYFAFLEITSVRQLEDLVEKHLGVSL